MPTSWAWVRSSSEHARLNDVSCLTRVQDRHRALHTGASPGVPKVSLPRGPSRRRLGRPRRRPSHVLFTQRYLCRESDGPSQVLYAHSQLPQRW